jgi:hypothetical protein
MNLFTNTLFFIAVVFTFTSRADMTSRPITNLQGSIRMSSYIIVVENVSDTDHNLVKITKVIHQRNDWTVEQKKLFAPFPNANIKIGNEINLQCSKKPSDKKGESWIALIDSPQPINNQFVCNADHPSLTLAREKEILDLLVTPW